jgi:class 3 adenylate cyclase/tetratricopeptide (TPR) repeat protein
MSDQEMIEEHPPTPPAHAAQQPGGTVTFLFTDIQGSTKLWERYPTAMATALARHDTLMREAIAGHNGYVFKTVGDAFCAAFPTASDGLNAAIDAQRALGSEQWGETGPIRVRMALHSGEPELRDNDYFGQPLNRVARLLSAGHGGQILISGATERYLQRNELPDGMTLRDMGEQRLKDLAGREQVYQVIVPGLPSVFPKLKTPPTPLRGAAASVGTSLLGFIVYIVTTAPPENRGLSLFSPASLISGFKGLVLELSALQDLLLLGILAGLLLLTSMAAFIWRRTSEFRPGAQTNGAVQFAGQFITFRTLTFLAASALIVLGAFAYQQYLWRVALPIPDDAIGFAMTREAAAASFSDELADSLFTEGQAQRIVVRELPVRFDARDTDKAREMGRRIGARAVLIYRTQSRGDVTEYVSYVVFTNPNIGLAVTSASETSTEATPGNAQSSVQVKEGIDVPTLRTESLSEMIDASAGIIAYHEDRIREAIAHLEAARPANPDAPNMGIVCFYLGNAYSLDNQTARAIESYDCALEHYERIEASGRRLGPQDRLILAKTYLERGRQEIFSGNREQALPWFEKSVGLREELLARAGSLERPADVRATYARLYAEMAEVYRYLDDQDSATFWQRRASEEADAIAEAGAPDDPHVYVQQSSAKMFASDCVGALSALDRALEIDPQNADARYNAAVILYGQGRYDLAEQRLQEVIELRPDDIVARQQLANIAVTRALGSPWYIELAYFADAERLYREILQLDPTNIAAHHALADFAAWRGDENTLNLSALWTGDDITLARSQAEWPTDPARYDAAMGAFNDAIQTSRVLAQELRPGDIDTQLQLASAYFNRQQFVYATVLSAAVRGQEVDRAPRGEQVLADANQIHRLAEPIVAPDSKASALQRLTAWDLLLKSYDREFGWYRFFAEPEGQPGVEGDAAKADALTADYQRTLDAAMAFVDAFEVRTNDERDAVIQVLFGRVLFAFLIENDMTAAMEIYGRITELSATSFDERADAIQHLTTICAEQRESVLAEAALTGGNIQQAITHYGRALEINPQHSRALSGLAEARFQEGDLEGAVANAEAAVELTPGNALAWADLGRYRMANGDSAGATAAFTRFLEVASARPEQERMGLLRAAIGGLDALCERRPDAAPQIAALVPELRDTLAGWESESTASMDIPRLYTTLAVLALHADDAASAQSLLEHALHLDVHQPLAHATRALVAVHLGHDAAAEIDLALAELNDGYWETVNIERSVLVDAMQAELQRYSALYPEHAGAVSSLSAALAARGS